MSPTKTDRRTEKSKRALTRALIELMIEKGYESTTVADVAERADVGRSTFYAHFADKENLLRESLQGLRAHLDAAALGTRKPPVHPVLAFSLPMLEHIGEAKDLFCAVVSRRSTAVDLVHQMLVDLVEEKLKEVPAHARGKGPVALGLTAQHIVGSFLAVCSWWMSEQPELTPAEVDGAFQQLVAPGVSQLSRAKGKSFSGSGAA